MVKQAPRVCVLFMTRLRTSFYMAEILVTNCPTWYAIFNLKNGMPEQWVTPLISQALWCGVYILPIWYFVSFICLLLSTTCMRVICLLAYLSHTKWSIVCTVCHTQSNDYFIIHCRREAPNLSQICQIIVSVITCGHSNRVIKKNIILCVKQVAHTVNI